MHRCFGVLKFFLFANLACLVSSVAADEIFLKLYPSLNLQENATELPIGQLGAVVINEAFSRTHKDLIENINVPISVANKDEFQYISIESLSESINLVAKQNGISIKIIPPPRILVRRFKGSERKDEIVNAAGVFLKNFLSDKTKNFKISQIGNFELNIDGDINFKPKIVSGVVSRRMCVWVDIFKDARLVKSIAVWFSVDAVIEVFSLKENVVKNQLISKSQLDTKVVGIEDLASGAFTVWEELNGLAYSADLPRGTVLKGQMVHVAKMINIGDTVKVYSMSGRVNIEGIAIANKSGNLNEIIELKSVSSGELFSAVVIGYGRTVVKSDVADVGQYYETN